MKNKMINTLLSVDHIDPRYKEEIVRMRDGGPKEAAEFLYQVKYAQAYLPIWEVPGKRLPTVRLAPFGYWAVHLYALPHYLI